MANAFDPEVSGLTPFITQLGSGVLERAAVTMDYLSGGAVAFATGLQEGLGPIGDAFGPANQTNMEKFTLIMQQVGTGTGQLAAAIQTLIWPVKEFFGLFYKFGEWQASSYGEYIMKPLEWLMSPDAGGRIRVKEQAQAQASEAYQSRVAERASRGAQGGTGAYISSAEEWARVTEPEAMATAMNLPRMATGGIVRRPTVALIGEAGPEAVVPLRRTMSASSNGQSSIVVNAPMTFSFTGGTQAEARATSESVAAAVEAQLFSILERLALQSGRHA
jgi:hypothetical protein